VAKLAVFAATVGALTECQGFTIPATHRVSSSRGVVGTTNVLASERSSLRFPSRDRLSDRLSVCQTLPKKNRAVTIQRRMAAVDNRDDDDDVAFLSDDPFVLLGLDGPTADKKMLKRAYKKRALKYHPDVVTDVHSSPEAKKKASDRFAKINGAYEQLMGKGGNKGGANSAGSSGSGSSSSSTSDSYGGWTPPHRRSSSSSSNSGYSSTSGSGASGGTDWRDYMPNYRKEDDEQYDTGGDSFGQIFSDLFTGAAGAAVSGGIGGLGGGIFNEFLEFLEGGAGTSGFGSGDSDDDAQLRVLLQTGTLEEVAEEMDDTDLVVNQLEKKSRDLDDEIFSVDAEAKMAARFSEKLEKEERAAELKARKDVVGGYLQRAQKRLLALQTRYKDLIAYGGQNDDYTSGRGRSQRGGSWDDVRNEATSSSRSSSSSSSSSSSYGSRTTTTGSSAAGTTGGRERTRTTSGDNATTGSSSSNSENSWMNEGFGSSTGRRSRGSGRRGSGRRRTTASRDRSSSESRSSARVGRDPSSRSASSYSPSSSTTGGDGGAARSPAPDPEPRRNSSTNTPSPSPSPSTSSVVSTRSNYSYDVPPHRRGTGSSYASRQEEDRRRMREVKVDEEFEKLKKELGL